MPIEVKLLEKEEEKNVIKILSFFHTRKKRSFGDKKS